MRLVFARKEQPGEHQPHHLFPHDPQPDFGAEAMATHDVAGKRILTIGCGLGLASLVLRRRGAAVVASDYHPPAATFLASTDDGPVGQECVMSCRQRWVTQ